MKELILWEIEKIEQEKKRSTPTSPPVKRSRFDDGRSTANVTIMSYSNKLSDWDKNEVGDIRQVVKEGSRIVATGG